MSELSPTPWMFRNCNDHPNDGRDHVCKALRDAQGKRVPSSELELAARARNAGAILEKRHWGIGVVSFSSGRKFCVEFYDHEIAGRFANAHCDLFDDPFTGVLLADEWYTASFGA